MKSNILIKIIFIFIFIVSAGVFGQAQEIRTAASFNGYDWVQLTQAEKQMWIVGFIAGYDSIRLFVEYNEEADETFKEETDYFLKIPGTVDECVQRIDYYYNSKESHKEHAVWSVLRFMVNMSWYGQTIISR